MAKQIKEALKEAVENTEVETPLSGRLKKLLARKKNLQRKKHNPNRVRR